MSYLWKWKMNFGIGWARFEKKSCFWQYHGRLTLEKWPGNSLHFLATIHRWNCTCKFHARGISKEVRFQNNIHVPRVKIEFVPPLKFHIRLGWRLLVIRSQAKYPEDKQEIFLKLTDRQSNFIKNSYISNKDRKKVYFRLHLLLLSCLKLLWQAEASSKLIWLLIALFKSKLSPLKRRKLSRNSD